MADPEKIEPNKLKALGIRQKKHLALFMPRAYDDFTNVRKTLRGLNPGDNMLVMGKVVKAAAMVKDARGNEAKPSRYGMTIDIGGYAIEAMAFGKLFGNPVLGVEVGQEIVLKGKLDYFRDTPQIKGFQLIPHQQVGRIVPVYPSKKGAPGDAMREMIAEALQDPAVLDGAVNDIRRSFNNLFEHDIIQNAGAPFSSVRALLEAIHAPHSMEEAEAAIDAARRISVCEILWRAQSATIRMPVLPSALKAYPIDKLIKRLPFPGGPTNGQVKVMREIANGIASAYPMRRLLSGDVGTGKTAAYAIPAVAAWLEGARVAIMIPNQLLMAQVASEMKEWFPEVDIKLVCNGVDTKKIDLDTNPMLVGTTALLDYLAKQPEGPDGEEPWRPEFLIVDEQQKMSREQREALIVRGTNFLEATATCVPRTAALVSYAGMDVSILNEFPVEKKIHSRILAAGDRKKLFDEIKTTVCAGGQAAIIYPKVGKAGDTDSLRSVEAAFVEWDKHFPGKVAKLHSKMKDQEKLDVMNRMKAGDFAILIASTVVEVGVTIPALRSLTVVEADLYGTSTLHQLRGRVARHGGEGHFNMYLPKEVKEETMDRLRLVEKFSDGFLLAEKDMEMRGFGDVSADSDEEFGVSSSSFLNLDIHPEDLTVFNAMTEAPAALQTLASGRRKISA